MGESARVVVLTSTCFLTSLILCLVALSTPSWVVQTFHGESQYGLLRQCFSSTLDGIEYNSCRDPDVTPHEWRVTIAFLVMGCIALCGSVCATVMSFRKALHLSRARWLSFIAAILFCLASLVFPVGFDGEPVGGKAYKLPESTRIGYSYVTFVVALTFVFIGQLVAMKILCPFN